MKEEKSNKVTVFGFIKTALTQRASQVFIIVFTISGGVLSYISTLSTLYGSIWGPLLLGVAFLFIALLLTAIHQALKTLLQKENQLGQLEAYPKIGLQGIAGTREETGRILVQNISNAVSKVKILTISGITLFPVAGVEQKLCSVTRLPVYILLMDPTSEYVSVRAEETGSWSLKGYQDQIESSIDLLKKIKLRSANPNMHLRLYQELPVFRMLLIDNNVSVSYYPSDALGSVIPVFQFESGRPSFYHAFEKQFDALWNRSKEIF